MSSTNLVKGRADAGDGLVDGEEDVVIDAGAQGAAAAIDRLDDIVHEARAAAVARLVEALAEGRAAAAGGLDAQVAGHVDQDEGPQQDVAEAFTV
jgi:hypothetical protein